VIELVRKRDPRVREYMTRMTAVREQERAERAASEARVMARVSKAREEHKEKELEHMLDVHEDYIQMLEEEWDQVHVSTPASRPPPLVSSDSDDDGKTKDRWYCEACEREFKLLKV
jgi:hypothetical protein